MSRWNAAGIHLSISVVIGLAVLALLFWVWYPAPYFKVSGGLELTMILLGVDLVLGPLMTLVVFKAGKKSLGFDLSVIAALQLCALLYGLHVIVAARPVFIVGAIDRFNVVAANEIDPADLAKGTRPEFSTLSWTGPRVVAARLPSDTSLRSALMFATAAGGADIERLPVNYVAYDDEKPHLLARAKPLEDLREKSAAASDAVDAWLRERARAEAEVVWLPIKARRASLTMLLDARTGDLLGAIDVNPW
ncbi:MAG: hypothetical protein J0L88_03380 [Xanthomonadales bacterium]|nr:hypothetical protein [Xanthomonadales bacterium]